MSELVALPMFPLSGVHFPGQDVPLHVFEPRYRALVDDVLAGNQEFGTALISGGCEVGGGDRRTGVGTLLKVQLAAPFEDGRWLLVTRGIERIRIVSWLDDDPYPRALVDLSPSAPADDVGDLLGRAARHQMTLMQEQHVVGDLAHDPGIVFNHQQRHAFGL